MGRGRGRRETSEESEAESVVTDDGAEIRGGDGSGAGVQNDHGDAICVAVLGTGVVLPSDGRNAEQWRGSAKFALVLETAALAEAEFGQTAELRALSAASPIVAIGEGGSATYSGTGKGSGPQGPGLGGKGRNGASPNRAPRVRA